MMYIMQMFVMLSWVETVSWQIEYECIYNILTNGSAWLGAFHHARAYVLKDLLD